MFCISRSSRLLRVSLQITEWLFDNVNAFDSFDQIQEFILGQCQPKHLGHKSARFHFFFSRCSLALCTSPSACGYQAAYISSTLNWILSSAPFDYVSLANLCQNRN